MQDYTLGITPSFLIIYGMAIDMNTLQTMLADAFPNGDVRIDDVRGDGEHYAAHVCTPEFAGKSRVQQHQMVYAALQGKMGNELHALQINTSIPQ